MNLATRLGWVAFFNDCSSEVVARALPLVLTGGLGLPATFVGIVEGAAEAAGILLRGLAGWLSDRMASRKPLVVAGYALSVGARACLLLVHLPALFGLARVGDRTGKGLRVAPRDAMIADAAVAGTSGAAFGVTRFLDTLGAMTGILTVLALGIGAGPMTLDVFRKCVWVALPFGAVAVLLLVLYVPRYERRTRAKTYLAWHVPRPARGYLAAVGLFALGNSSDAFLVLRASELGFSFREILGLMLMLNALAAALALPVGRLSDRIGRVGILALGWTVYAATYLAFGLVDSPALFAVALAVYGAFYGFTEGTEKALLADLLPAEARGAGYGALQLVLGLAALPASLLTGWLMACYGSGVAFPSAAAFALAGTVVLLALFRRRA